jgi:DHA1 family chloramphenicol resistance protein-like MFS transporter
MAANVADATSVTRTEQQRRGMPLPVYVLGLSLFAMGSAEFLMAGVLPQMASDLHISLPTAGTLISAFAVGVMLGAPPLAALTLRLPRRVALVTSQALFVASIAVGLLTDGYWPLLIARFVSGLAYAGFWGVASITAVSLVPPDRTARALSVVVSGLTLAMVVGGPLGTVIGDAMGWRGGFWAVLAMTTLTAALTLLSLRGPAAGPEPRRDLGTELRALNNPRLWVAYGTAALSTGAYMVTFGYLGAVLADVSKLPVGWVPAVLSLFGIGAFAGLTVGGRSADRQPFRTMTVGIIGIVVVSLALAVLAGQLALTILLVFLLGVAGFVVNPAVLNRAFTIAQAAPTLAGATNVAAFQVGITVAPLLGGYAISAGFGLTSVGWVGALFGVAALGCALLDARLHQRTAKA